MAMAPTVERPAWIEEFVGFAIFWLAKMLTRLRLQRVPGPVPVDASEVLLAEIRDILRRQVGLPPRV